MFKQITKRQMKLKQYNKPFPTLYFKCKSIYLQNKSKYNFKKC